MRQGTDDLDAVLCEELGEVAAARGLDHREVAAIDDVAAERARLLDEPAKVRVQFRGAAGDVDNRNRSARQRGDTKLHRLARHLLAAIGARVDVTVFAGLVAELADVDLKDFDLGWT